MVDNKLERIHLGIISKDQFLQEYSVYSCVSRYSHIKDIKGVLTEYSPSLVGLKKETSKDYVLAYIELWILSLSEFVNVKYSMSPAQISETAFYIYQDYFYFKISDITLLFTNAKKGYYGDFFHALDGAMILGWFKIYAEERADISESIGIQKADEQKEPHKQRISDGGKFKTIKHGYDSSKLADKSKRLDKRITKGKGKRRKDK
jgi:hypothetical protein